MTSYAMELAAKAAVPYKRYVFTPDEVAIIRSRCEGTDVVSRMDGVDVEDADDKRNAWIATARAMYAEKSNDDIEIDDDANLSRSDVGCWVQGWLHVREEDLEDCGVL